MDYIDHIADILGTRNAVVAPRLTKRLREKGYDLAVSQKRYAAVVEEAKRRASVELLTTITLPRKGDGRRLDFKPISGGVEGPEGTFTIAPARYAKLKVAVRTSGWQGYKSRACRLAGAICRDRYTGRERSYIMSPAQAEKFYRLFVAGWDASCITHEFESPRQETETAA